MTITARHEGLILGAEKVLGGVWNRNGFAQAVSSAVMESRLDDEGTEDAIPSGDVCIIPDSYQIDPPNRTVRIIEVNRINNFRARQLLSDRLDYEGWTLDLYWVEPQSGVIFRIDGDLLAASEGNEAAFAWLKQNALSVGRAEPIYSTVSGRELKLRGKRELHKQIARRLKLLSCYVFPACENVDAISKDEHELAA